jgi:hypothetical protein
MYASKDGPVSKTISRLEEKLVAGQDLDPGFFEDYFKLNPYL